MKKIIILASIKSIFLFLLIFFIAGCLTVNVRQSYIRFKYGAPRGVYLGDILVEKMLEKEVKLLVESLNQELMVRPRNAYLDRLSGQILPEIYGKKIDVSSTVKMVMEAEPYSRVEPAVILLDPEITGDVYRKIQNKKGSFRTWFGGGGRGHNIRLAAASLNNYLLAPGEIFSFNKATGPRLPEKGYKLAPIIVGNYVIPGFGGGVCQVSTTLYNAVINAGLEVIERYPHSRPVDYVPYGRDATVSNYLDFKFRNNRNSFLLIKSSTSYNCLVIEIWE